MRNAAAIGFTMTHFILHQTHWAYHSPEPKFI